MEPGDEHIREQGGASTGERPRRRSGCDGIDLTASMLIRPGRRRARERPQRYPGEGAAAGGAPRGISEEGSAWQGREREWRRLCGVLAEDEGE